MYIIVCEMVDGSIVVTWNNSGHLGQQWSLGTIVVT